MGVIWQKVWFDLWHNKTRTLLAVLSIAAGVFAVGAIFGMSDLLLTDMDESHRAVLPAHIDVRLDEPVERDVLLNLRSVPGVENVDPYNSVSVLYKVHPDDPQWRPGVIQMRDNFNAQIYELLQLRAGHWPAQKNEISVERMAAQFLNVQIGETITFKINDRERTFPITGLIRHPFVPPPQFEDLAFFFMNGDGLERFDIPLGQFNSFYVRVTPYSPDYAKEVATRIKDKLAKQDIRVAAFLYEDPNKHWGRSFFDGITWVEELVALICVVISAVLIYNTLSNLITQQTNQIGILKAIGGRTATIVSIYLVNALIYGALGLIIALPLGALVASKLTGVFLGLFNIDYTRFEVSQQAVIFQLVSALAAPLLAGLPPTLQGAGITVREAIASYGLGGDFRSGRLDRLVEGIGQHLLPSYYATALANLLRHKGRLILTQLVLVAAGGAFLMVMSLNSSIALTLDNFFAREKYDTEIDFRTNARAAEVLAMAQSVSGVEKAELRLVQPASMFVAGQLVKEAGIGTYIRGIPADSDFYKPLMVAGRWLESGDGRVVVLSRDTAEKNHIQLGDLVTLDLGEMGKDKWQVIGLYEPVFVGGFNSDTIFAPQQALFQSTKKYDQGTVLLVRTASHGAGFAAAVTDDLKNLFDARNLKVTSSQVQTDLRKTNEWQFSTVTDMLMALSVIVAIVGGIALMGALSIGVIERTKEIGVLRAVGARSSTVLGIFIMEGILQGLLSWLIALPLSYFLSPFAASAMGHAMFGATLDYQYNWNAVLLWLGMILAISVLASVVPAQRASRLTVRDTLAYE